MATKVTKTITTEIAPKLAVPEGKFKLYYFPANGRAFASRVALSAAGIDFDDIRLTFEEFGKMRIGKNGENYNEKVPLGTFPILVFPDGERIISQSTAIARFAGKYSDLYPQDPLKSILIDEVIDTYNDLSSSLPQSPDKDKKKELREKFAKEQFPKYFNFFSKRLDESGGPFILGENLSIADLVLFSAVDSIKNGMFDYIPFETIQPWKNVIDLYEAVKIHPIVINSKAIR